MEFKDTIDQIVAVVVLYNTKFSESDTIRSLHKSALNINKDISLLVYDNSNESQFDYCEQEFPRFKVRYILDKTNQKVSKAYNECAYIYKDKKKWMLLLDQDTMLSEDSLAKYISAINDAECTIYVPKIFEKNTNRLISPARYICKRGFRLQNSELTLGISPSRRKSFINSASLVSIKEFLDIGGYDEKLFYYSDHEFFQRFSKKNKVYFLIDLKVFHELSSSLNSDSESTKDRYRMLCEASHHYGAISRSLLPQLWSLMRGLKLVYKTKNIDYLKIFFKSFCNA